MVISAYNALSSSLYRLDYYIFLILECKYICADYGGFDHFVWICYSHRE